MNAQPRDFHRLFRSETNGYLGELNLSQKDKDELLDARQHVKEALYHGLRAFAKKRCITIEPRFMSQGSAVYKTQNSPNHIPPQQVDHDYGCYLPFSYLDTNGSPAIAAQDFFAEVDLILQKMAAEKKYHCVVTNKATCSRLVINDRLHIDVPLYSVPDEEMHTIIAYAASRRYALDGAHEYTEAYYDTSKEAPTLTSDKVHLAHRKEGWKKSDPRKLNLHFKQVLEADPQLLRICRYLKGLRDQMWKEGGPCSIALMILAAEAKAAAGEWTDSDAEAFLAILKVLPGLLDAPILNPTDKEEKISVTPEDRQALKAYVAGLAHNLEAAIHDTSITDTAACALVQQYLGKRFPAPDSVPRKQPGRIEILSKKPGTPTRIPPQKHTSG